MNENSIGCVYDALQCRSFANCGRSNRQLEKEGQGYRGGRGWLLVESSKLNTAEYVGTSPCLGSGCLSPQCEGGWKDEVLCGYCR